MKKIILPTKEKHTTISLDQVSNTCRFIIMKDSVNNYYILMNFSINKKHYFGFKDLLKPIGSIFYLKENRIDSIHEALVDNNNTVFYFETFLEYRQFLLNILKIEF